MPVLMQNSVFSKSKLLDFFHPPYEKLKIQGQGQPWNICLRDFRSHQLLHVPRLKNENADDTQSYTSQVHTSPHHL